MVEKNENILTQKELTPTQKVVTNQIIEIFEGSQDQKVIVALNGLSGIGKSTIEEQMQDKLSYLGIRRLTSEDRYNLRRINSNKCFITTAGHEFNSFKEQVSENLKGYQLIEVVLPPMTKEETNNYIEKQNVNNNSSLNQDQLIELSLGVPVLVNYFLGSDINEETAKWISAGYLKENAISLGYRYDQAKDFLKKFFQQTPSKRVLETFDKTYSIATDFEGQMYWIYKKMADHVKRGILEESPKFKCDTSTDIYNKMSKNKGAPWINIFIPNLKTQDLQRINQAIGCIYPGRYERTNTSRFDMFSADFRKVVIWQRDINGEEILDTSDQFWNTQVAEYAKEFESRLGVSKNEASVLVHSHEHEGMSCNPVRVGWLVESMLQQKGISYYVDNRTLGMNYCYNPEKNEIVEVTH